MSNKVSKSAQDEVTKILQGFRTYVDGKLDKFQEHLVFSQKDFQGRWNTINVLIRVMVKKGLFTEEEFIDAGKELMKEFQENHRRTMEKVSKGEMIGKKDLIPTDFERLENVVREKVMEVLKKEEPS